MLLAGLTGGTAVVAAGALLPSAQPAQARARSITLPAAEPAAAPGAPAREPYSSGGLGPWRQCFRLTSGVDATRAAAEHPGGVFLLGDSVGTRLLPRLRAELEAAGRPMSWNTWNGRPAGPAVQALARLEEAGAMPPSVVVVTGSNDVFGPAAFAPHVDGALAAVGERTLLWVTPYVCPRTSPTADIRNSALLGLALERAAARNPRLVLVRWFELLGARPGEYLDSYVVDGIHPSDAGTKALTGLVTAALPTVA